MMIKVVEKGVGRGIKKEVIQLYFKHLKERVCFGGSYFIPQNDTDESILRNWGKFMKKAYKESWMGNFITLK